MGILTKYEASFPHLYLLPLSSALEWLCNSLKEKRSFPIPKDGNDLVFVLFSRSLNQALSLCIGRYSYDAAVALSAVEGNNAVNKSEEGVILTHAYILTGIVYSTTLANDDVAGNAGLSTPNLNA